ncbi:MAG: GNAT family N-acetyltransferase [Rhizobiales bacterium]|nr:GNAT family N-acetyltransferase [Hyphomicrobiales bacterium]MBO6699192.1 GNAT family N-acetyltransferase [Hyphomicrobiales bacterium]MBO6736730.1 GNAT family N-acetyltransferase [Hyphomicrobiales bacterium]MBO6912196.1 GNAT family N-acetyltransferase [Hyphomicrobiales bacterium]MBO6956691.1 GNAT family N-acetyltransferase [Hyphomicrobiales bacterium]
MINTDRLVLRRARLEDAPALFEVFGDPQAMAYWDTLPHADITITERFVRWMATSDGVTSDDFVVELEGTVIGKAGFWRKPEIGYILHRNHWGKGLAKEALTVLIARAFQHHGWDHITAEIDPRNERSRRLLLGLGFAETGFAEKTIKVGDQWVDSADFHLDRP